MVPALVLAAATYIVMTHSILLATCKQKVTGQSFQPINLSLHSSTYGSEAIREREKDSWNRLSPLAWLQYAALLPLLCHGPSGLVVRASD